MNAIVVVYAARYLLYLTVAANIEGLLNGVKAGRVLRIIREGKIGIIKDLRQVFHCRTIPAGMGDNGGGCIGVNIDLTVDVTVMEIDIGQACNISFNTCPFINI